MQQKNESTPAGELANFIANLVEAIQGNLPLMKSSASFDSSHATLERQLHDLFIHYDKEKLLVALLFLSPPPIEIMEDTEFPNKNYH